MRRRTIATAKIKTRVRCGEYASGEEYVAAAQGDAAGPCGYGGRSSIEHGAVQSWDLGAGFEGAVALAATGWEEGGDRVKALADDMREDISAGRMGEVDAPQWARDVAGTLPDVPAYLAGMPDAMLDWRAEPVAQPVVKVVASISGLADVSAQDYVKRGASVVALVDLLESTGRRVELVAYVGASQDHRTTTCYEWWTTIKRPDMPLSVDVCAFFLAHPAAHRRLGFALREIHPASYRGLGVDSGGYGYSRNAAEEDQGDVYAPALEGRESYGIGWVRAALDKCGVEVGRWA
jgi:hypothetical protein